MTEQPTEGSARKSANLVWIDCEMTGLDLARDALVEIACVVTDAELQPLDPGVSVVIKPPQEAWDRMSEFVRTMHRESGLFDLVPQGVTLAEAGEVVLSYVKQHVPDPRRAPLAGSSVYVDRGFLARDLPELEAHLHYRIIDVSSLKELVRRWYPKVFYSLPTKTGNHRALGDVMDSIAELAYYRRTVFADLPRLPEDAAAAGTMGTARH